MEMPEALNSASQLKNNDQVVAPALMYIEYANKRYVWIAVSDMWSALSDAAEPAFYLTVS